MQPDMQHVWKCRLAYAEIRPRHGSIALAVETIRSAPQAHSMREALAFLTKPFDEALLMLPALRMAKLELGTDRSPTIQMVCERRQSRSDRAGRKILKSAVKRSALRKREVSLVDAQRNSRHASRDRLYTRIDDLIR